MKLSVRLALALLFLPLQITAIAQEKNLQRIGLKNGDRVFSFMVYGNLPLGADMSKIRRVVLVFHGLQRNADHYFATAKHSLQMNEEEAATTLIIAPQFLTASDKKKTLLDGLPLWQRQGWIFGADAISGPAQLSSFDVIDGLVQLVSDRQRFPALQSISLAGHSAGAQLLQRYAVFNSVDGAAGAGAPLFHYVIANPSSYLYFTDQRPSGESFAPYDKNLCATYNYYRYGFDHLNRYTADKAAASSFERYAARDVTYLLGSIDNDPNHHALDKTCGAEAEGPDRLDRGLAYLRYEKFLAKSQSVKHSAYEVIGADHDQKKMFESKCAVALLFNAPPSADIHGATCTQIE